MNYYNKSKKKRRWIKFNLKPFISMRFISCLLLLLIEPSNGFGQKNQQPIQHNIDLAIKHQKNNEFSLAFKHIKIATNSVRDVKDSDLKFNTISRLASILIDMNEFDDAYKSLKSIENLILNNKHRKYVFFSLMGNLFDHMQIPEKAIAYKLRCVDLKPEYVPIGEVATLYLKLNKRDSAIYYYKLQLSIAHSLEDTQLIISANNNLGFGYSKINDLDSAIVYYTKSLFLYNNLLKVGDEALFATINGNLGHIYFLKKDFVKSIRHLKIDYDYSIKEKLYDNCIMAGGFLCDSYWHTGRNKMVSKIIHTLIPMKSKVPHRWFLRLAGLELKYYDLLDSKTKLQDLIQIYTDSTLAFMKILGSEKIEAAGIMSDLRQRKNELEISLQNSKLKSEKNLRLEKELNYKITLISISIISILIIMSGGVWIRNRRKQHKSEKLTLEKNQNKLDNDLKNKKSELTNLAINISRNREYNQEILNLITQLKNTHKEELNPMISKIIMFIKQQQNNVKMVELFQENIDIISSEFFNSLSIAHSNLTQKEKEVCSLIRLNISSKEVASIKNISVQSARTAKYRLKKKLNLPEEVNIVEYLQKI